MPCRIGLIRIELYEIQSSSTYSPRDTSVHHLARDQETVNKASGKREKIYVNLEKVYPNPDNPSEEYCFEELRASAGGWSVKIWRAQESTATPGLGLAVLADFAGGYATTVLELPAQSDVKALSSPRKSQLLSLNDENLPPSNMHLHDRQASRRTLREDRGNKTRKIKVREVRNETQTSQYLIYYNPFQLRI